MNNQRFKGYVDGLASTQLKGWAIDLNQPDIPLTVSLRIGDQSERESVANVYHDDLANIAIKSPYHGFVFDITTSIIKDLCDNQGKCAITIPSDEHVIGEYNFKESELQLILRTSVQFHIEFISATLITGWCADSSNKNRQLDIGLYYNNELVTISRAGIFREDLKIAGYGDGCHGFHINIDSDFFAKSDNFLIPTTFRLMDFPHLNIAEINILQDTYISITDNRIPIIKECISDDAVVFFNQFNKPKIARIEYQSESPAKFEKLFVKSHIPNETQAYLATDGDLTCLSGYLDHFRFRAGLNKKFDTSKNPRAAGDFLHWYINYYCPQRGKLRAPLSKEEIAFLNEPVVIPGQNHSISKAHYSYILTHQALKSEMDLNSNAWFLSAIYNWIFNVIPNLYLEDCLVPHFYRHALLEVSARWKGHRLPMNNFFEEYYKNNSNFHFLDINNETDRRTLYLILLVKSARTPGLIRFISPAIRDELLATKNQKTSTLGAFLKDVLEFVNLDSLNFENFADIVYKAGYDLKQDRFLTISRDGHRLGSAALPQVPKTNPVDVQLIGPIAKASGLGQATRMSALTISRTKYSHNFIDSDIDNPGQEGYNDVPKLGDFRRAKINILHINAESIPLTVAFEPDVFTGAYNIGYFFWELNLPAMCHFLSQELLDEIWVASEYGKQIYEKHFRIPVYNVGMCFEAAPTTSKIKSRSFVEEQLGFSSNDFIFLSTFDSYSLLQRKNPIGIIKAFQAAFKNNEDVKLIIKTQNKNNIIDIAGNNLWKSVCSFADGDRRILIIDETLSYHDLISLKSGCDAYISLHRSEGWGFGMIEAMNLRVPVICTGYSGNMEFCTPNTAWLVDFVEVYVEPEDYPFTRSGHKWAEPSIESAANQMISVYSDELQRTKRVEAAWHYIQSNFSTDVIAERYSRRLAEIFESLSEKSEGGSDFLNGV